MKWAMAQLRKLVKPFNFEYDFDLKTELKDNTLDVLDVKSCHVIGECIEKAYDDYLFKLHITTDLVMQCSVSLEPCDIKLDFDSEVEFSYDEENEDIMPIVKETIDLDPVVLTDIIVNIPMKVVKEGYEDMFSEEAEDEGLSPLALALKNL